MRLSKLNIVIGFGLLAIIGVIIMQLFLLRQAYQFEKNEIDNKIHFALQDVVEKIYEGNNTSLPISNQIKKITDNYYIVNVDDVFENKILEHYLMVEFNKVKLDQDFEYAIYNCGTDEMVYGNYISSKGEAKDKCEDCFTKNSDLIYYFAVRFPNINKTYFSNLKQYWIYTAVLFLVLIIYVYSVFLLLQQKHYSELQTDFINNMTHEFKTPLSSILIASNYAQNQKEIQQNPKLSKYLQIITKQSNKLNQHIEQILSIARTNSHQIQLQKTQVNFYKTLELIKENIVLKQSKNISLKIASNCNVYINADEFHFYNILYNLIDNAVKYGTKNPVISVSVIEKQASFFLVFTDNGPGIPEKDLPFIFDKFYRVKRKDSEEIEGFGIGLAYVKKICDLHHWKITVKNTATGLQTEIIVPKKDIYYE
ncbi:sensor histidine kinase [Flavobacterium sp.]|uniref:sensor histidine kinase n=1 Tax=Flavobacterium sp. TaxID=239 RepID=UPI003527412D